MDWRRQVTKQEQVVYPPRRRCMHWLAVGTACAVCAWLSPAEIDSTVAPSMNVREVGEVVFSPYYESSALRQLMRLPMSFDIDHGMHGATASSSDWMLSLSQVFLSRR